MACLQTLSHSQETSSVYHRVMVKSRCFKSLLSRDDFSILPKKLSNVNPLSEVLIFRFLFRRGSILC